MPRNAHNAYLESRILSAEPVELICLLYQGAISEVREARRHLQAKDIRARSKSITKVHDILSELTTVLDHKQGGPISKNLAQLYDYMMRRITEANFKQIDEPLAETLGLLTTLKEGWDGVLQQQTRPAAAPSGNVWAQAATQDALGGSQAWSF
ncbi:MAG: flagellar export chaperone FliS [Bryobacteraceae bacterium]|jgi:flagellar protein FliS